MSADILDDETWTIAMGDRTFDVPRLPFRISRVVYPICQRLSNAELPARVLGDRKRLQLTDEEVEDLAKIAFLSCQAADHDLTSDAFDDMPITPPQLYGAFFAIRMACGGWARPPKSTEDQDDPGEAHGDADPSPTSTSTRSSRG